MAVMQVPLARRLREARAGARLTVRQLADQSGVTERTAARWLAGDTSPSYELLARVAQATGKPLSWFFEEQAA